MAETERSTPGKPYGLSRVLDKKAQLPAAAQKIDNALPIYANELLIHVEKLNIDAASFVQMEKETGGDANKIGQIVLKNCQTQGRQKNRVTGSGGMLVGTVKQVGTKYKGPHALKSGDRVASLVSLILTPLHLDRIINVNLKTHQIAVQGHAILFEKGPVTLMPEDLADPVAMAAFDVAGAPKTVSTLCQQGDTVVIVGAGGKAGLMCCYAAREAVGTEGQILGIEPHPENNKQLQQLEICDVVLSIDATDPVATLTGVQKSSHGKMGDVVVNVTPIPNTEVATILCANPKGTVLFFGMATSFSNVVLGAEGLASEAKLLFGNGYYPAHDVAAMALLRKHQPLLDLFNRRYQ